MKLPKIKFSHHYWKLKEVKNGDKAWLLEADKINLEFITPTLREYDTLYFDKEDEKKYYPLPDKGDYLLLLFVIANKQTPTLFTTIRRWTPRKSLYYYSKKGTMFQVEIKEEAGK